MRRNGDRRPMVAVQDEIVAEMAGLEDALQKYEYLVGLGRCLEVPDEGIRQEAHAVAGCQSRVWIRTQLLDGRLYIQADSDALITRGVVALVLRVFDGRTPAEILDADLFFLDRTGLGSQLSPARSNGLAAMVRQIRKHAEEASASS